MTNDPDYETWARNVPSELTTDTIWRMTAYRLSLYAVVCARADVQWLSRHRTSRAYIDQLMRAVGGISASLDEGYSRSSSRERAHFYEYALGSAREARGWYYKCADALPPERLTLRLSQFNRIIRILTAVVPREREAPNLKPRWRDRASDTRSPDNAAASSSS